MRIKELETIYLILDSGDDGYESWYGTEDDIIEYLEAQKANIPEYGKVDGFVKNLERYGLTYKTIN
jgi:hypothetical protein